MTFSFFVSTETAEHVSRLKLRCYVSIERDESRWIQSQVQDSQRCDSRLKR